MNSLLSINDLTRDKSDLILNKSFELQNKTSDFMNKKYLGLFFEKPSTRTRVSFQIAIKELGGTSIDLNPSDMNLSRSESYEDTFRTLSQYLDVLVIRTNNHQKLELAKKYFNKPVINALSELEHPCQVISDLYTLLEKFKTLNLNICWFGDINNVCISWLKLCLLYPEIKFTVFSPKSIIKHYSDTFVSKQITFHSEIDFDILSNAHCLMTDVFISMNDFDDQKKIDELQKFQINDHLIGFTPKDSVFMHCLPANIGKEVTASVFKSKKSLVWRQAKNRMISQKGILACLDL